MNNKAPDRRVQRTRKLLHQALMSQVLERGYESITVQDVLDRADVGRSTFYMHFRDKEELLTSSFQYLKSELDDSVGSVAQTDKCYEDILAFSLVVFEHASKFRKVIRALLRSNAAPVVRQHLNSILVGQIASKVEKKLDRLKHGNMPIQPELLIDFLASTHMSLLIRWMNSKDPVSPRDMDQTYRRLVAPCLASIFE